MKVVVQRVSKASCKVDGKIVGEIGLGLLLLIGFTNGDTFEDIEKVCKKIVELRIFNDSEDKMNLSLLDVQGKILSISQFTLYANIKKGRRPSFENALKFEMASKMYDLFNEHLETHYLKDVQKGIFGQDMKIELLNDGPVTILIDSKEL